VALLYVYYSKLRFSLLIRRSITDDNQEDFVEAWRNLRNSFRVFGIYVIAAITLYMVFFGLLLLSSSSEF
jgi:predicted PurR-regulated permease PerM